MSISDRLAAITARVDEATAGPWEKRTVRGWEMVVSYATDAMIQLVAEFRHEERDLADAEFIAHARADVPWLVEQVRTRDAALQAVLDLHKPTMHQCGCCGTCDECDWEWPCDTVRAIEATLGDEAWPLPDSREVTPPAEHHTQ